MRNLIVFFVFVALCGCSKNDVLEKFSSPEDQATARGYIHSLRTNDFNTLEKAIDPSIKTPTLHSSLEKMAALIPAQDPTSEVLVGAHRFNMNGVETVNTTFEYQFGKKWILASVAGRKKMVLKLLLV